MRKLLDKSQSQGLKKGYKVDKPEQRFNSVSGIKEGKVSGYAILWNKPSYVPSIGRKEVFQKGSLKITDKGCPLLFQHNKQHLLGNSLSKTLTLKETPKGLYFECMLPKEDKRVRELCERGDITGASISFYPRKQRFENGQRIVEDALLDEISLVHSGQHETEVSFRSNRNTKRNWSDLLWVY